MVFSLLVIFTAKNKVQGCQCETKRTMSTSNIIINIVLYEITFNCYEIINAPSTHILFIISNFLFSLLLRAKSVSALLIK